MTCRKTYDELAAYFDGELSPDASREMGLHIGRCEGCSSLLQELQSLRKLLESAGKEEIEAPPGLKDSVISCLRADGAFVGNRPDSKNNVIWGLFSGGKLGRTFRSGIAAAVGVLLISGVTWGWLSGNINNTYNMAYKEIIEPTTNHLPGEGPLSVDPAANPDPKTGPKTDNNNPVSPAAPNGNNGVTAGPGPVQQQPPAEQESTAGAEINNTALPTAFLSRNKVQYSGNLQLSTEDTGEMLKQVKDLAEKYDSSITESGSGAHGTLIVSVSSDSYTALFGELKEVFSQSGQLKDSSSKGEDLNKPYMETLTQLNDIRNEKSGMKIDEENSPGQLEQLSQLEKEENALIQKLNELQENSRTSKIITNY